MQPVALRSPAPSTRTQRVHVPQHDLRRGMTGAAVKELQLRLVALGHLSRAEMATGPGIFGPRTESAVKEFQARHGVPTTGYYGPRTRAAMDTALNRAPQAPAPSGSVSSYSGASTTEPAHDYRHVWFRGVQVNLRTVQMLKQAETYAKRMGVPVPFQLTQGSYSNSVGASAGTHAGGGALDIRTRGLSTATQLKMSKALRMAGFAAWTRGRGNDSFAPHIHAIAIGDRKLSPSARTQVAEYFRGGDGLRGSLPDPDRSVGRPYPDWARKYR